MSKLNQSPIASAQTTARHPMFEVSATLDLEEIRVDMAEMKTETKPAEFVACVGSCIALCLYDSLGKCGGMAHIMLPQASTFQGENLPAKFADTAVPALANAMRKLNTGCILSAKIAGGANMFPNIRTYNIAIGTKNADSVKAALALQKIPLRGEDIGGTQGRKVTFDSQTGRATVRFINGEVRQL